MFTTQHAENRSISSFQFLIEVKLLLHPYLSCDLGQSLTSLNLFPQGKTMGGGGHESIQQDQKEISPNSRSRNGDSKQGCAYPLLTFLFLGCRRAWSRCPLQGPLTVLNEMIESACSQVFHLSLSLPVLKTAATGLAVVSS
jgi:hypothetical protein